MPFRYLFCLSSLLILSACSDPAEDARASVLQEIGNTSDIEFTAVTEFSHGVVCGEFKQVDKWGESSGMKRFVYRDETVDVRPSKDDLTIFCSESPAAELQKRFGITLNGENAEQIRQVIADLSLLSTTLERFYDDNSAYPDTKQGLQALREQPKSRFAMRNYPEGGYLDEIPNDPWQKPYHYKGPTWAGVKSPFTLRTNGADGAVGGTGEAVDIDAKLLPYLQYIANLPNQ